MGSILVPFLLVLPSGVRSGRHFSAASIFQTREVRVKIGNQERPFARIRGGSRANFAGRMMKSQANAASFLIFGWQKGRRIDFFAEESSIRAIFGFHFRSKEV
ncbi:hypothetical protein [Ensifer sp. LCM 4579]|uniref:hypothetical protein n=1 Tax=Ensifer sp. LCM 4579 TaxID=1848292 RepID=UPI00104246BE|nr:hypothetical protein [Ensifer sp. LCM 4579]